MVPVPAAMARSAVRYFFLAHYTFRCADNLADGHGLVYNPGERVEATSNFLFAVVLAGLIAVGFAPDAGALLVNGVAL